MRTVLDTVTKSYGRSSALDNVSLDIKAGQIVAVLGPNGAGKTTLLRCLAGVVVPTSGSVRYDGEEFSRGRLDLRRRLQFLPDFPFMFSHLTPVSHLGVVARLYSEGKECSAERATEILGELDLLAVANSPLGRLSRGQIYKTALAALLLVDPGLWLLDEPFASGMDPKGISYFKSEARRAAGRGCTIIYSTQILEVAERFSDRVCVLEAGRVHYFASVAELQQRATAQEGALEGLFRQLRGEQG